MSDATDSAAASRTADPGRTEDRPSRSWLGITVLLLLGMLAAAGFKSYRDLAEVRAQEAELRQSVAATVERIRRIDERIERIENDPWALERLVREELGLVRPKDLVIVLPEEPEEPSPPPEL